MATPIGHSIVGYTLARMLGVRSRGGLALAVGAASLPDVDFLLGYVADGDFYSMHREVITHKPAFPLIVGLATGAAAAVAALRHRRRPLPREVWRPAALAAALVGSHIAMDKLPVPYTSEVARSGRFAEVVALQGWNMVVDIAVYGSLAALALTRSARTASA